MFDRLMENVYRVDFIKKNYEYKEEINFDNLKHFFFQISFHYFLFPILSLVYKMRKN